MNLSVAPPKLKRKLTKQQEIFCQCYVGNGGKGMEAMQDAGYKTGSGGGLSQKHMKELLARENIQQRIAELKGIVATVEQTSETVLSPIQRMEWLTSVIRGEVEDASGKATLTVRIKALDLLNKMTGQYVERVEHTGDLNIQVTIDEPVVDVQDVEDAVVEDVDDGNSERED